MDDGDKANPPPASDEAAELDENSLAALMARQLPRKNHYYSQQLPVGAGAIGDSSNRRRDALRKHSLDEGRVAGNHHRRTDAFSVGGSPEEDAGRRADAAEYTSQFLDRQLSSVSAAGVGDGSLPEFVGSGGGAGIFRVPERAAMHLSRPPALELRPHPLRETQVGRFLRTVACTETQLWAGQECGVRFWNFADRFSPGSRGSRGGRGGGDDEAAPFYESSHTSPTMCLVVDASSRLVWTGHKDGKIRSWPMDHAIDGGSFREGLTWQAHRAAVLCMVITIYGDIWSGSEGGSVKIWTWESIEKSLSLSKEERHMAALLVERAYIDLRAQVTYNGVCSISAGDVKYMLSDNCKGTVWSSSSFSFALWDARTKDLLKVFNIDGQIENRVDISSTGIESSVEDDAKPKHVSSSKKEKSQGTISFFQRSRNALIGAADAVRRAAAKSGLAEENRRTEALAITVNGTIWSGYTNGAVVQWDGSGNRLQELNHHNHAVQCFCAVGPRLWVGYLSGIIQVLELDGTLIGSWIAHCGPVIKMAVGGGYVFTLANHGGIRGWCMSSPGTIDSLLRSELSSKKLLYTRLNNIKILAGTWNVGQGRASPDSLISWMGAAATGVDMVVAGLQEVEMGAGFLAMAAAKETVGLEGSNNGQWWLDAIGKTLDYSFERVGSRQLAGLHISVWARKSLKPYIGDVDAAAVPCGFGRTIGNKGAVGLRLRLYDRIMCFVNCHFAAHLEAVNRRNADFDHVYRTMVFSRPSSLVNAAAVGVSSAVHVLRGANAVGIHSDNGRPELAEADMVIFLGDFNYRLFGITYDEARDFVSQRSFDWLREKDQLQAEMKAGKVFQGMREGQIKFPPTYKFERRHAGLAGYDSGEKKRIPAWCDRILYRDSRSTPTAVCSLDCPVISSISRYEACMDVTDSDHKPVRCIFNVEISHVDESIRRREFGEIISSNEKIRSTLEEMNNVPETKVSTNTIILQNQDMSVLRITNKSSKNKIVYDIICEGQTTVKDGQVSCRHHPRGAYGFPNWLEVHPFAGMINPSQSVEISLHLEDFHTLKEFIDGVPQNWFCEDTRDKEIMLIVRVRRCFSSESETHRICVCHSFTSSNSKSDSKYGLKTVQSNLNQPDGQQRDRSKVDDLKKFLT